MKFVKPSQLDRSNPGIWPIYYHILLWVLMVVIILFLYGQLFKSDIIQQQKSNRKEIATLQAEYKSLYQYQLDLPLYEQKKAELRTKLSSLLEFLPAQTEMPDLIDATYKAAYESDINFTQFKPEESINKEYYNIEPISLSASTNFSNFAEFVQKIGELPRILNVHSFSMKSEADNKLDIASELQTYIYNQDVSKFLGDGDGDSK